MFTFVCRTKIYLIESSLDMVNREGDGQKEIGYEL